MDNEARPRSEGTLPRATWAGGARAADVASVLGLEGAGDKGSGRRWLWVVLLMALLGAGSALWLAAGPRVGPRYVTVPVTRGNLTVIITATGSVQPLNKVDVSSELSGTVRRVLVDYNSAVVPGQVLAELDTDRLEATARSSRAKLVAAQAQIAVAEATVAETEHEAARKQELVSRQISAVREMEVAVAAHRRAVATLEATRAQLAVAEAEQKLNDINLARAVIRAPIRGVVLKRNVDPGQTVAVSLQAPVLFTIAEDLAQMELQVDVDEADVGGIAVGLPARFGVDAYPDREFPARIRDIRFGAEVIQGVVTYKAVLTIDNSDLSLRPGMTATAAIIAREVTQAVLVPNAALRFTPPAPPPQRSWLRAVMPGIPSFRAPSKPEENRAERTVWVPRDGTATRVPVVVGASDGKQTEIVTGELAPGDAVIVDAAAR